MTDPSSPTTSLRVLVLEDRPADADLIVRTLESAGFYLTWERVETERDYRERLTSPIDLILADYAIPGFGADEALTILQHARLDIPFVIVSGSIGEDLAVRALQRGAADYLLKDRLTRLPEAVRRALENHKLRLDRARLEEQFRHAQKMEAIGRLAGGIAHDFNNLLTAILGYAQLAIDTIADGAPGHEEVEEIRTVADRATTLTRQLLAFSRKQVLQPTVLDLNGVVSALEGMLRRLIGEDIELVVQLEAAPGRVKADPSQLEQIIANLVVNARDAMPHGGCLTLETRNVAFDDEYVRSHVGVVPGDYVLLAVSDTGVGMDAETLPRIFEPFFTTKGVTKGTGLGLSTVYGIVAQSGGHIWVYSEVGRGSTFKIYLPHVSESVSECVPVTDATSATAGAETVLVVEDDVSVRHLACTVLSRRGYTVLQASDAIRALELSRSYSQPIDLVITDMVMPEMGGRVLADELAAQRRGLKVLYMSGYSAGAVLHDGGLRHDATFIEKPFTPDALAAKVRAVLDAG